MRYLSALALVCGCLFVAPELRAAEAAPAAQIVLRFDGVYQSEKVNDDYCYYLRFYEDGTVLYAAARNSPPESATWLNPDCRVAFRGTYTITGSRIVFSTKGEEGTLDHEGRLKGLRIDGHIFSRINNVRVETKYTFVEFAP